MLNSFFKTKKKEDYTFCKMNYRLGFKTKISIKNIDFYKFYQRNTVNENFVLPCLMLNVCLLYYFSVKLSLPVLS